MANNPDAVQDVVSEGSYEEFYKNWHSKQGNEELIGPENLLETITSKELLERDFPPQQYLVKDFIKSYGFTAISGPPYSFKSFLALYFLICIASGKKVFDKFEVEQPGACLIIDKENELVMLQERLKMLGVSSESDLPIHFLVLPEKYTLTDSKILEWTIEFVKKNQIVLILYDSFIHIHKGNENDSDAVRSTFTLLKQIPCAKMFITHHRKPTRFETGTILDRIRGSSDIGAELENHLAMDVFGEDAIRITQGKNRGGKLLKPFTVKPVITPTTAIFEYGGEVTEEMSKGDQARKLIIDLLADGKEKSRKEIVDSLISVIGESTIDTALKFMESRKEIEIKFEGRSKIVNLKMNVLPMSYSKTNEFSLLEQSYLDEEEDMS